MRSPLEVLPQDVTSYLEADPYFVDVPVFFYRAESIGEEILKSLAGMRGKANKVGVAVVVNMPTFGGETEIPGPQLSAQITIQCVENPPLNFGNIGTRKSAEQIAQQVAELLQHHFSVLYYSALYPPEAGFITPSREFKDHVCWEVHLLCRIQLNEVPRCAMPAIDPPGGYGAQMVTLSCVEPGATILYTTDETLPRPAQGSAPQIGTIYTEPFAAAGGTIVRACAWVYGKTGSFVNDAEFGALGLTEELLNPLYPEPGAGGQLSG